MDIPILDLSPEIQEHWAEYNEAIQRVLLSTQFIQGNETKAFEREVAAYLGVKHAVGMNSGTDALIIGLRALGIGPGDEVVVPGFTFYATAEAVSLVGATPVFADIDPLTFNADPESFERLVTPRTKALIPVHLFGQGCDMDPILRLADKHGIAVLEDVAQAFGAEYRGRKLGTLGDLGTFSFFPSKNLGAFGDGGLAVTNDDAVAEQCRMLANHGSKKRYHNELLGYNSRLDSIQAAILRSKLKHVDDRNQGRRVVAHRYNQLLADLTKVSVPVEASYGSHVYHQYTVRLKEGIRDRVHHRLTELGVATMIYYPVPVPHLKVYSQTEVRLPVTEAACAEVLSLPIWPQMTEDLQVRIAEALKAAVQAA